jgi:hypothetical protein
MQGGMAMQGGMGMQGGMATGASTGFGGSTYGGLGGSAGTLMGGQGLTTGRGSVVSGSSTGSSGPAGSIYGALGIVSIARPIMSPMFEGPATAPTTPGLRANPGRSLESVPSTMQADFQDLMSRSDQISPATRAGVQFAIDRGVLVLRGTAATEGDAQALESLLRFAPGVRTVRNEMKWQYR